MKFIILFSIVLSLTLNVIARPQDSAATITKYDYQNNEDGGYSYSWTTSNGITREEIAEVINAGAEDAYLVVRGFYSYFGPDGQEYRVGYTSYPEYGFEAEGEHLTNSAGTTKTQMPVLGIPSAALASLSGGIGK